MSGVARTIQSIRPHIPQIRFPGRVGEVTASVDHQLAPSVAVPGGVSVKTSKPSTASKALTELPARYRRQLISEEEMAYIERGGPE